GCTNSASQILTIVPKPQVNFNPVSNFCVFGLPFNITQFSPPLITSSGSGQFIGNGIIGSTNFHPDSAGPGIHAIKYVYSDTLGCADSVTQNFVVDTLPHVNLNLNAIKNICFGNNVFDLTQVGQAVPAIGGIYLGKNV